MKEQIIQLVKECGIVDQNLYFEEDGISISLPNIVDLAICEGEDLRIIAYFESTYVTEVVIPCELDKLTEDPEVLVILKDVVKWVVNLSCSSKVRIDSLKDYFFKIKMFIKYDIYHHSKAERLFEIAWDEGHSNGYTEVEAYIMELVDLIT